jgi:chromosome partitioning protein
MTQTIAVISHKGGTGKTTTVRTLADAFRRRDIRTLAVDLDPQGNLSEYFNRTPLSGPTVADVLSGRARARAAIRDDLIPADLSLAQAELLLGGKTGREVALRRALREVAREYELVLIDCPPSLGLLTVNALVAATRALITAEAQYFAVQGVDQSMEVIEIARETLNPRLSLLGVLLNLADLRTAHSRGAFELLKTRYGAQVFGTVVRASIAYAESSKQATSILDHRADLAEDYIALADEVLERLPRRGEHGSQILEVAFGGVTSSPPPASSGEAPELPRRLRMIEKYTELERA